MTDGPPPRHLHPVDDDLGRRPPQDRLAEEAVLTTLLRYPELGTQLADRLDDTDFYWPVHATIWNHWHTLHARDGVPPDAIVFNTHLVAQRQADAAHKVVELLDATANPIHADRYAATVLEKSKLRQIVEAGTKLTQLGYAGTLDQAETYIGDALDHLADTAMRFGATTHTHSTGLADLSWILNGTPPASPPPTWCRRTDGTALFYDGRVNGLFGDPECGKTWIAQCAGIEALHAGKTFAFVDVDHNGQDHTAARLLLLGASIKHLADPDRFRYYEPEDSEQLQAAITDITNLAPAVVVLDSIGEILPMLGVKSVDNDEVTAALRRVAMPPAKTGSCVITIDHLPKSAEARATGYAIGGTAKKRAMDGAYLRVEARQQPTPGRIGRMTLRIEKDRTGELRKSSGGGYAGTFTLDSTQPHVTSWTIGRDEMPKNDDGTFRPTGYMEKVSRFIEDNDQCTGREIEEGIPGKAEHIRAALKLLITEGFVSTMPGTGRRARAKFHHSIALYREAEDDHLQQTD